MVETICGVSASYLGGRLVLGSGRTWPHDFLFLTGFFSGSGVPAVVGAAEGVVREVWARTVRLVSILRSGCSSSVNDFGDIMSRGLTVVAGLEPNKEGYISSGVESRDSAGESSYLMLGDAVCGSQESILVTDSLTLRRRTFWIFGGLVGVRQWSAAN